MPKPYVSSLRWWTIAVTAPDGETTSVTVLADSERAALATASRSRPYPTGTDTNAAGRRLRAAGMRRTPGGAREHR